MLSYEATHVPSNLGIEDAVAAIKEVLLGTFVPPPDTDPYAVLLLRQFKKPTSPVQSNLNPMAEPFVPRRIITTEDHIKWGKKTKESTSAGISGIHFGHLKAHCKRVELAEMDASMRSVVYSTGHSYAQSEKGIKITELTNSAPSGS